MSLLNSELEGLLCSPSRLRTLDDQDLVAALGSGCNDALAVLFERHSSAVLQRIRAILRDDTAADEIVHEVFLDFYQRVKFPYVGRVQVRLLQCAYPRIVGRAKQLPEAELKELELLENEIITSESGY
jgi:DNA-directed RNA polymerase specialized sigma24 family protein